MAIIRSPASLHGYCGRCCMSRVRLNFAICRLAATKSASARGLVGSAPAEVRSGQSDDVQVVLEIEALKESRPLGKTPNFETGTEGKGHTLARRQAWRPHRDQASSHTERRLRQHEPHPVDLTVKYGIEEIRSRFQCFFEVSIFGSSSNRYKQSRSRAWDSNAEPTRLRLSSRARLIVKTKISIQIESAAGLQQPLAGLKSGAA